MFDGRWRAGVERVVQPVGATLRHLGITADHLTATGLVLSAATAVAVATGHLGVGVVLLVASALPDLLDGAVAKASGTASTRGAFFDSVIDRISDSLVLGGLGWYLASAKGSHWAVLPLALLGASTLVSYERAKAESLGLEARGGLMERAERVAILFFGLLFSPLLVPILWLTLVLTLYTAGQRFVRVWRQAEPPPRPPRPSRQPRRRYEPGLPRRWEARWEARREARRSASTARARRAWRRQVRTRP